MPSSISSSERLRRWPWGLLCALALLAVGEHLLWSSERVLLVTARYTPPGPDGDPLLTAAALRRLASDPRDGVPVLLLGSSQVREGLDCAEIERRLPGRPCANLAISAGSPLDMLALQEDFERAAPRRVVVLGLFPKVLHMAPKDGFIDESTLACLVASGGWRRVGGHGWVDLAYGLAQELMPTLRYKDALASAHEAVDGRWSEALGLRLPPQPQRLLADAAPQPRRYFEQRIGRIDADFPPVGPYTGAQEQALERLIEREAARGGRPIVIDFPTHPGYGSTLPPEARAHYAALLERLGRRTDVRLVRGAELPQLAAEDFLDFTHLGPGGRARMSARVAELVAHEPR